MRQRESCQESEACRCLRVSPTLKFHVFLTLEQPFLPWTQCHHLLANGAWKHLRFWLAEATRIRDRIFQSIYMLGSTEQREHLPAICPHSWRQGSGAR